MSTDCDMKVKAATYMKSLHTKSPKCLRAAESENNAIQDLHLQHDIGTEGMTKYKSSVSRGTDCQFQQSSSSSGCCRQ